MQELVVTTETGEVWQIPKDIFTHLGDSLQLNRYLARQRSMIDRYVFRIHLPQKCLRKTATNTIINLVISNTHNNGTQPQLTRLPTGS